jgi:PAS domain S-box-containing protein
MNKKLHILHLEDNRNDAELIKETLAAGGIECDIVLIDNRDDFTAALEREQFDIILADYNLPTFDGLSALAIASAKRSTAPFLFVSGTMGEEIAIESLKHGATDYIVKSNLGRLVPSIRRALREAEDRRERARAEQGLRESEERNRSIIENIGIGISIINPDFTIHALNSQMKKWFPDIDVFSHPVCFRSFNAPPRERIGSYCPTCRTLEAGQVHEAVTETPVGGEIRHYRVVSSPVKDAGGSVTAAIEMVEDITDRIVMEERERLAFRKWQATFDAIRDAVCLLDLDLTILQCNQTMADYLGKPASELTGVTSWELIHGASGPIEGNPVERMKTTLQREREELEINGKWMSITVDPILDGTGGLTGAVYIITDVSERKSMEQGLRDSLDKFRSVAEQSLVGIYIIQDGVFKYVNKTFGEIFHYSAEELINKKSPRDITVPEDWNIVEEHGRGPGMGSSSSGSYEIRGLRKDGEVVPVEIYESRALFEGRTANIGALLNISQRKKAELAVRDSEGKLQAITRTAPDAIILLDDAGKISYWNPAAERMFGYGAGEALGKEILFILPERFQKAHAQAFKRFTENGEGLKLGVPMELAGLRKDGTEFPLELSLTGFLLNNRRHASGIIRDLSERKKLEAQLLHAQKMEAIGTLAGGIAHDFNNILNVIIGYGSLVLESMEADNPSWERMREVLAAADRAANLTKRLLTFSRKEVVDFKHILVDDIVSGVEKLLSRIIGEDIELRIQLADKKAIIFADAGQLEQVLMNLVTNARDAMPKGGCLTISTGSAAIDDGYITAHGYGTVGKYASISVADTGVGMNAETESKIFEPFYTTKGVGEGTGLGLSIAYGIIKQHKGFIQVYSEVGSGTVFKILLPMSDEAAGATLVADASEPQGGTETILIAEDEAPLRDLLRIILESFGYTVLAAEDGEEAVRMFLEHRDRIRLFILDMVMPKKNGKDAADEISKVQPGVRILFMSGYSEDVIKKQGMIEEGLECIQKPVSPKVLLKKVRELLDA